MNTPIPRSALILAVAGLAPLVWSVATQLSPALADVALRVFGPRFVGPYVGLVYSTIILSFQNENAININTIARPIRNPISCDLSLSGRLRTASMA